MTDDYPSIYHPDIGEYIEIKNELAFKTARVVWDDIAAKYEPVTIPVVVLEQKDPVQVKPALITDARDLSLAKSVIPSDDIKQPVKMKKPAKKPVKQPHQSRKGIPNWVHDEEVLIQSATSRNEAWDLFKKEFPGRRNANAVKQKWSKMHPPEKKGSQEIAINDHVKQTFTDHPRGIGVVIGKDKTGAFEVNFGSDGRFTYRPEHLEVV